MLLQSIRRMLGSYFEGQWRWTHYFLLVIWIWMLVTAPPTVLGYFLGDTKAVFKDCVDHWVLQGRAAMPLLYQMTVCVDIRVIVPGAWVAFSYSSVHAPRPELGLEGDETALYGWLLRVKHRFPVKLSPTVWHRVCLRRDVGRNSFSLEVDGVMVAERTVIAQAIPSSGSLWLGCRPRDQPSASLLGEMELYLFRMWADVGDHGVCEDGTVIGWDSQFWGVTSSKAREKDARLMCAASPGFGPSFSSPLPALPPTAGAARAAGAAGATGATPVTRPIDQSEVTGSPLVKCDIAQLCSNENAYYWMFVSVEATEDKKTESDVHDWLSEAFGCDEDGNAVANARDSDFSDFCRSDGRLQTIEVSCNAKQNIRQTSCGVLLQLRRAVPVCSLQLAALSALQQAANQQMRARLIGELERVGRGLCEDVKPSGGGLVRCMSPSSLDDFCQSEPNSTLTCSVIDPTNIMAPTPTREPCSRKEPLFCDCSAFCSDSRQFFGLSVNISSSMVDVELLQSVLSGLGVASACNAASQAPCREYAEVSKHYQGSHLECHGTKQRLYSCMVILEMLGPVDVCSLTHLLQLHMDAIPGITKDRPLARMVVCGPPGLPVSALLASNLTWVASDLLTSEICWPNRSLLKCESNETLAVLLTESCQDPRTSITTNLRTLQPSSLLDRNNTTAPTAATPSVTNATQQHNTTAESNAAIQLKNESHATIQPNVTTPLTMLAGVQNSTAQPVTPTSSKNMAVTPSRNATAQRTTVSNPNTTLPRLTQNAKPQNTTVTRGNATQFTTLTPINSTLPTPTQSAQPQNTTTAPGNATQFTTLTPINSTLPTPTQNTKLQNTTMAPGNATQFTTLTPINSTLPTPTQNTKLQNTTMARGNATQFTTPTSINSTLQTPTQNAELQNTTVARGNATKFVTGTIINSTLPTPTQSAKLRNTTMVRGNATQFTTLTPINSTLPTPTQSAKLKNTTMAQGNATQFTTLNPINSTLPTPKQNAKLQNTTVTQGNATKCTPINSTLSKTATSSANNRTFQNRTTHQTVSKLNTTTFSPNYTSVYNVTSAANYWNLLNITMPRNATIRTFRTFRLWTNHTTESNRTTAASYLNNAVSQNVSNAIAVETRQNTTALPKNTTRTVHNTTTTHSSTLDNTTSTVNRTTPTKAPQLNNHTANYTSMSVTTNVTKTNRNNTDSTTISPTTALNTATEVNGNLSSNATALKPNFNQTTDGPGFNLTMANTTKTTTTTTTTTNATQGPPQAQTGNATTEESLTSSITTTPLQTTSLTGNTTTVTAADETTQNDQDEQEQEAEVLLDQIQNTSNLNSSQVEQVVTQLEKLLEGSTISRSAGQNVLNIISNLMEGDSMALSTSGNRLIRLVDSLGLKLVVTGDSEILSSNLLVLAIRAVDGTNFPTTSVNIFSTDNIQLRTLWRSRSRSSEISMGSVYLPSSLTEGLSEEEQKQASRVQFTFFTSTALFQDASLNNQTIVGPVLGSSVANLSISDLSENIQFTIRNNYPVPANYVASCVFWDFDLNGGGGGWNPNGCSVLNATEEETTCSCDHLTSFAILLDLSREGITDRQQALILTFITYIGCGISAVFLAFTLLTYLSFEKLLRDIPSKILVQLCFSLLFLNLVFLLDGWLALHPATGLCISTAFFLHYFLLTSFTWAGLEALHMYLSIVRVFTPYLSRYMLKFSLLGWGVPLIVVIIVLAVDKNNYGLVTYGKYTDGTSDDFCWLRNHVAFYVGVVAYFLLIFTLCLVVFIVVLVQLQRIKRQNRHNQSPNRGLVTELRSIAGLIILLGLTWGFALFAWGPLYLPFVYLFSIFNSLQGFFIFALHCAVKENVRRQWRTYLCCGGLRLAENSDWSRTATHKTKKLSVNTSTTPVFGPTSRSSSVTSEGTNSSGSVFADSGISDGSNSDVVLNEIHRRNAAPPSVESNDVSMDL